MPDFKKQLPQLLDEAKNKIATSGPSDPSALSVAAAEQAQTATGWWWFTTPPGIIFLTTVLGLVSTYIILPLVTSRPQVDAPPIHIIIDKMPDVNSTKPTPLPIPTKSTRIVTVSKDGAPLTKMFWAEYEAKGYTVTHYKDTDAKAIEWSALVTQAGGVPCVLLVDDRNYYGGGSISDAAKLIAKFGSDK